MFLKVSSLTCLFSFLFEREVYFFFFLTPHCGIASLLHTSVKVNFPRPNLQLTLIFRSESMVNMLQAQYRPVSTVISRGNGDGGSPQVGTHQSGEGRLKGEAVYS